jgi:broad specificity phosphatase PhoE
MFLAFSSLSLAQAVFVVRHADKISESDERLSDAGRERAKRLAKVLAAAGIRAIYATDTERAKDTAGPLAQALKLPVTTYDVGKGMAKGAPPDASAFAAQLRRDHPNPNDTVLVVGHSNTVPAILEALGCKENVTIGSQEYDNLFVVVPGGAAGPTLVRLKY